MKTQRNKLYSLMSQIIIKKTHKKQQKTI